ncbi:6-phosphogluconate dehydrogenase [Flavobacterium rivuli WB 3.3-2 = DSM 21788]|uniref:6-phosphogluconate dehydrogenase n=1 Tax=Flavobacterium rivuli WB 3.3-2 = DSM 21788 TaxID=1121895 RepID=A0A0A2LZ18_9FLAO|nr:NAD(P)-dependent oxidoreductase [Flavobacterium rivuli]KGO85244.1 6-phosphogluconate dehydrogenase [Flavobacterium rivuli WB 3.3-2 = DSM 21788]
MQTTKIGWIGLGIMGKPMCSQLINAGYNVTVYNRSKVKEAALTAMGATAAPTPAALIHQTDVVFIMVTDDNAINQLFDGEDGLLSANASGRLIINMSTVSPGISKNYAQLCSNSGNSYLDAPVSGSQKQAEEAQLVIMVGGDVTAFTTAKPLLDNIGKMVTHTGAAGTGNTAKLAINTLLAIQAQGLAEAVSFAAQNGLDPQQLLTLINNSALASTFIKIKGDAIINDNYKPAFALKNIVKDLSLAKDEGMASPLGTASLNSFKEASVDYGDDDIIAIYKLL